MFYIRFSTNGRSYDHKNEGRTRIVKMLPNDVEYIPIIWLLWCQEDDFFEQYRGYPFSVDQYNKKQRIYERKGRGFWPF